MFNLLTFRPGVNVHGVTSGSEVNVQDSGGEDEEDSDEVGKSNLFNTFKFAKTKPRSQTATSTNPHKDLEEEEDVDDYENVNPNTGQEMFSGGASQQSASFVFKLPKCKNKSPLLGHNGNNFDQGVEASQDWSTDCRGGMDIEGLQEEASQSILALQVINNRKFNNYIIYINILNYIL